MNEQELIEALSVVKGAIGSLDKERDMLDGERAMREYEVRQEYNHKLSEIEDWFQQEYTAILRKYYAVLIESSGIEISS